MEEEKRNNHKEFKIFIIIFLIASVFLLKEENQNKLKEIFRSMNNKEKTLTVVDFFKYEEEVLDLNVYDNTIALWKNNKISFKEFDGTNIIEKEFNFENPFIHYGDNNIYVMDKSTGDIYFLDKKGETLNREQLNKKIFNLKESNKNLIYHIKSTGQETINVLDKDGIQIGNCSYEDKNILTYEANDKGSKNAIAVLDVNEGIIKSHIDFYGKNNEKVHELDILGEIIVFLNFTSKDEVVALTDNGLYFIKDGNILWKKNFDLMKDIYMGNDKIYVLYSNYLETIYFDGKIESKVGFGEDYKKILPFQKNILLYGNNNLTIVEKDKQILKHEENILGVYTSKDNIVVLTPEEIKTYKMDNKQ